MSPFFRTVMVDEQAIVLYAMVVDFLTYWNSTMKADRGFQIQEELLLRFCTLTVLPGACLIDRKIANFNILTPNDDLIT